MCDGWGGTDMHKKRDKVMFGLLVVELVALNLGAPCCVKAVSRESLEGCA